MFYGRLYQTYVIVETEITGDNNGIFSKINIVYQCFLSCIHEKDTIIMVTHNHNIM